MQSPTRIVLPTGLAVLLLAGCATTNSNDPAQASACAGFGSANKQTAGTAIGAVGAGLLTGLLTHNVAAGLAGAAVGGLVGNRVGASLDADDCRTLVARSEEALRMSADGTATTWNSARANASATIVPSNTRFVTRSIAINRESDVVAPTDLDVVGKNDVVRHTTAIHLAPSSDSGVSPSGPLNDGTPVRVVGKVRGGDWLMVARNGIAIGYLQQTDLASTATPHHGLAHHRGRQSSRSQTALADTAPSAPAAFDLDAQAPIRPADLDAPATPEKPGAAVVSQTVTASVQCRDLTTTMTAKGQSETKAATACRSPDGAWELDDSGKHA